MTRDVAAEQAILSDNAGEAIRELTDFMEEKGGGHEQWRVCVTADPCVFAVDIILAGRVVAGEWTCKQMASHEAACEVALYFTRVVGVSGEILDSQTSRFVMLYRKSAGALGAH